MSRGVSAQKLSGALFRYIRSTLRTAHPVEIIDQGSEGGRVFSFSVKSHDGGELLVSVTQTAEPPKPVAERAPRITEAARIAADRERRYRESYERRRRRFLGEA